MLPNELSSTSKKMDISTLMTDFDVFNGDADGICSLVQMRLAEPREARLVTGVKRKIDLLADVEASAEDRVTVLDVSMKTNGVDLRRILDAGAHVFYADHHMPGDVPEHPNLSAHIDTSAETCTALIVDEHLGGAYRSWAVTAAFGDNFPGPAREAAAPLGLNNETLSKLERLGTLINYNGYGASLDDLYYNPSELYLQLVPFETPMAFMAENVDVFSRLDAGYEDDMVHAREARALKETDAISALLMPNVPASRRVSGVYGNALAQENPGRAHAILTDKGDGGFVVSVRAPLKDRQGAGELCSSFDTGGGRSAAAGINHLPEADVDRFIEAFEAAYSR